MEYLYWQVEYVSCESNRMHGMAQAPAHWTEDDVKDAIMRDSGYGTIQQR